MPDTPDPRLKIIEAWFDVGQETGHKSYTELLAALDAAHIDALTAAVGAIEPWLRTDDEAGKAVGESGAIDVIERAAVLAILRGAAVLAILRGEQ